MKNSKKSRKKGFTLIELIVVIAIIAVLIAIAVPKYQKARESAAITAHKANVSMLKTAGTLKLSDMDRDEEGDKVDRTKDKHDTEYVDKRPEIPKGLKFNQKEYSVTINAKDSSVTVSPDENALNPDSKSSTK